MFTLILDGADSGKKTAPIHQQDEDKEAAKVYAKAIREKYRKLSNRSISARVYKLTKYDTEAFGI